MSDATLHELAAARAHIAELEAQQRRETEQARKAALKRALDAVCSEYLDSPQDTEGDDAYQNAVRDCADAIEALINRPAPPPQADLDPATAPGHTDLMVSPESLDAFCDAPPPVTERVRHDDTGALDEVVTAGPAHLERTGRRAWFLAMYRADGSSLGVWLRGDVVLTEERGA